MQVAEMRGFVVVHDMQVKVVVSIALYDNIIQQEVHISSAHLHFSLCAQAQMLQRQLQPHFYFVLCYFRRTDGA